MTSDDAIYSRAVDLVIKSQRASVSMLQRSLRIGFSQASGYLDEMEVLGIVSAPPHRTVLIKDEAGSGNQAAPTHSDITRRSEAR
jgi:DNA segregation ATPase FtsK/SpoIIIE-like protein